MFRSLKLLHFEDMFCLDFYFTLHFAIILYKYDPIEFTTLSSESSACLPITRQVLFVLDVSVENNQSFTLYMVHPLCGWVDYSFYPPLILIWCGTTMDTSPISLDSSISSLQWVGVHPFWLHPWREPSLSLSCRGILHWPLRHLNILSYASHCRRSLPHHGI